MITDMGNSINYGKTNAELLLYLFETQSVDATIIYYF